MRMRVFRKLRARWNVIWMRPDVRMAFIIVGTILGTGTYYYPIFKHIFFPEENMSKDQLSLYDKEELYPIKVRKQREQAVREKMQTEL